MKRMLLLLSLFCFTALSHTVLTDTGFSVQTINNPLYIDGGTDLTPGAYDNEVISFTLPFAFTFNGNTYTTGGMSCNGYLTFGSSPNLGWAPISNALVSTGAVSALGCDLYLEENSELRYQTFGIAPDRYTVFQWRNLLFQDLPFAAAGFQIMLYETSNRIAFRYIDYVSLMYYLNPVYPQVGLRGAVNTDFFNRFLPYIHSLFAWENTVAGTANTDTCALHYDCYPMSGLQFTFSFWFPYMPPYSALCVSPWDGNTNSPYNANLVWSSGGGAPNGYRLFFGTNGEGAATPTNLVNGALLGNVTQYDPPADLDYRTTYYWQIVPYNTNGYAVDCPIWSFTTSGPIITDFPYIQNFETWPPPYWDMTDEYGLGAVWQGLTYFGNTWAWANLIGQGFSPYTMTTPPFYPTHPARLTFCWSHLYTSLNDEELLVQISTNMADWTTIWQKRASELNSYDGATATTPGYSYFEVVNIPSSYVNSLCYLRFHALTHDFLHATDVFVDNVSIAVLMPPDPVTLTYPANGATGLPPSGFNLTWTPALTGGTPDYYTISFTDNPDNPEQYYWETPNTYYNPVTEGGAALALNTTYYWMVTAWNDYGLNSSDLYSFQTVAGYPPDPVINIFPANGGTGLPLTGFDLSWAPAPTGGIPTSYGINFTDIPDYPEQNEWFTTDTHFNPVTDGGLTLVPGTWYYWMVTASNAYGYGYMNMICFQVLASLPLPFNENWAAGSFQANYWSHDAGWTISETDGIVPPCARFDLEGNITEYTGYLTSFDIDCTGHFGVKLTFELSLINSSWSQNYLSLAVWNGSGWYVIKTYSTYEEGGWGWYFGTKICSFDISPYVNNRVTKIRFAAEGWPYDYVNFAWLIDNIEVEDIPVSLQAPSVTPCITEISGITYTGVTWNFVPFADWFAFYSADEPGGPYTLRRLCNIYVNGAMIPYEEKKFFRVTAGAGNLPPLRSDDSESVLVIEHAPSLRRD